MDLARLAVAAALVGLAATPARAIEGAAAAGPIGGTDIRVAHYPPPGLYGGLVFLRTDSADFVDGSGNRIPGLEGARLYTNVVGPFLAYVPDIDVLGGRLGLFGTVPIGQDCGRLIAGMPTRCRTGFGDPYMEVGWSRAFGSIRRSSDPDAFPIVEGLAIAFGVGVIIPAGDYDARDATLSGVSLGNNIWGVAPSIAVTYTTPPLIADGTEFSAKFYWNTYWENPDTRYHTGDLINIDFAVTERIGRFQAGLAGFYAFQIQDDRLFGVPIAPDGRRAKALNVGAVLSYDLPAYATLLKVKALITAHRENLPSTPGIAFSLIKKLY